MKIEIIYIMITCGAFLISWFIKFLTEAGWNGSSLTEEFIDYTIAMFINKNAFGLTMSIFVLITMIPFIIFILMLNTLYAICYVIEKIYNLGQK